MEGSAAAAAPPPATAAAAAPAWAAPAAAAPAATAAAAPAAETAATETATTTTTAAAAGAYQPSAPVSTAESGVAVVGAPAASPAASPAAMMTTQLSVGLKKKRGRPRKYGPDGSVLMPLNARPISASVPYEEYPITAAVMSRGRGRLAGFVSKQHQRIEFDSLGEMVASSAGANFTPHVITVAAGEDVTMKMISFSQQGPRAICILSANGAISNVTLRQHDSSGGTLTYEGRFEILSLSGSFMPTENGGTRSRSGGMSVSLSGPDGRVVGGGVAGLLVAATPVQVVVGSFLPSYRMEHKTKKPKFELATSAVPISSTMADETYSGGCRMEHKTKKPKFELATPAVPISSTKAYETYSGGFQPHRTLPTTPKPNLATSPFIAENRALPTTPKPNLATSPFSPENWAAAAPPHPVAADTRTLHSLSDTRNSTAMATDINVSLPGG